MLSLLDGMEQSICAPRFISTGTNEAGEDRCYDITNPRGTNLNRTPKPDHEAALRLPEPPEADYSDELTAAHIETLKGAWTQDETQMGAVVHEFRW